jgi:hypothetical protein
MLSDKSCIECFEFKIIPGSRGLLCHCTKGYHTEKTTGKNGGYETTEKIYPNDNKRIMAYRQAFQCHDFNG